jgi:EmrB/QacA subfamily drug resistance transporter
MTDTATLERGARALPEAPAQPRPNWWALLVLMTGTVMVVLDFFAVNVALPTIQSGWHAGGSTIEWALAGYGLTFAVLMVTAGRLGDRFGRRRVFCGGLALFALASTLCGLAPSATVLVGARFLQGAAAALISPSVLSLLGVIFTGADRARAISVYGMVMGVAAASGQLIGGALVQLDVAGLGWRTIFLVNLPVAAAGLLLAPRLVPESRSERATGIDLAGVVLVTAGLVALVLPLVDGQQLGWPAWTWACLVASPVLLAAFAFHQRWLERSGRAPLMAPSLFRSRSLRAGLATQLGFWCGQAALFLVLALYLQDGRRLGPLQAGLFTSILAVAYLATSLRAPFLALRYGRDLIALGALTLAAGEGLLALAVTTGTGGSLALLVPGLLATGAGMGLCLTPLTTLVLAHAGPGDAGAVSGALSTMQQVGGTLGVAITGAIFFGALKRGVSHSFELSVLELACLLTVVAALTRLLPGRRASS